MKVIVCTLLIFICFALHGQVDFEGVIRDSQTSEPLPFCPVALKNKSVGSITNEQGFFKIQADPRVDTLLVTYVGYKKRAIAFSDFVKKPILFLEREKNILAEVTVYARNEFLYALFDRCRQKLVASSELQSKVYFTLETEIAKQPVEVLECFYNGTYNNASVKSLQFKNGRCGVAPYGDMIYQNVNSSKVFTFLNLTKESFLLPVCPLQLNKRSVKKDFELVLQSVSGGNDTVYEIAFTPIKKNGRSFSGEAWIEKKSGQLKKITLSVYNTKNHPFLPRFKDFGKILSASMQVTKTFNEQYQPDHIDFHYQLNYRHIHSNTLASRNPDTTFEVRSKGLLYFYDLKKLFHPLYFKYDDDVSDYRKITSLTYNEGFWNLHRGPVYSEKMRKAILYFKRYGGLINYGNVLSDSIHGIFENNYIQWHPKERISLKKDQLKNDTLPAANDNSALVERYQLSAQIFMDLNPTADSIQHFTSTIFDVWNTYYNIKEEPFTNAFLNIYFDLHEIARREMELVIKKNKFTVAQFDSLYKETNVKLEKQISEYLRSVQRGSRTKELERWNLLVYEKLKIDNLELFNLVPKN